MNKVLVVILLLLINTYTAVADNSKLRVAVAANFSPVLKQLAPLFTEKSGIQLEVISAASGVIFQQIQHGAPFDVFMSADSERIVQLAKKQLIVANSQHTYAIGRLALYSAKTSNVSITKLKTQADTIQRFAIANPNIAPYGLAARQALQHYRLWRQLKGKLIQGINVNQTFQQVESGAVDMGIVALSQLTLQNLKGEIVPSTAHAPIKQQLAILKTGKLESAEKFVRFILSEKIQTLISKQGYDVTQHLNQNTQQTGQTIL